MNYDNANIIQKFMEHIKNFDNENFVRSILFCFVAPTIKGIKAACLINFRRHEDEDIKNLWKQNADKWLKPLGVQWLLLNDNSENKKCENQLREGCYWKVYGNIKEARRTFNKYRKAECDAARLILAGK